MTVRPTLAEAEYRLREWLQQELWGGGHVGRVIGRVMVEYDRRGRQLGMPAAPIAAPEQPAPPAEPDPTDTPHPPPPCHVGKQAHTCGFCADLPGSTA